MENMPEENINIKIRFLKFESDRVYIANVPTQAEDGLFATQTANMVLNIGQVSGHSNTIAITLEVTIKEEENQSILLIATLTGIYGVENYEKIAGKSNYYTVPKPLAQHLVRLVVGALRGVIYTKVKDTAAQFVTLGEVNLEELVPTDITVAITK
jgi:hypothetical protein